MIAYALIAPAFVAGLCFGYAYGVRISVRRDRADLVCELKAVRQAITKLDIHQRLHREPRQ